MFIMQMKNHSSQYHLDQNPQSRCKFLLEVNDTKSFQVRLEFSSNNDIFQLRFLSARLSFSRGSLPVNSTKHCSSQEEMGKTTVNCDDVSLSSFSNKGVGDIILLGCRKTESFYYELYICYL
jgi:hypothetical protein